MAARLRHRLDLARPLTQRHQAPQFLRAAAVAVVAPALLRLPLDRVPRLVGRRRRGTADTSAAVADIVATADAAIAALHPITRWGCLTAGVTRYDALRRAGIAVDLCFGVNATAPDALVRLGAEGRVGHCWLELDGEPVAEPRDPRALYTETFRLRP
ncbi:MAG: Transglutaminase-like superfamily [Acidimicrobiaceae bacterium]|jgi:hypothetical protein|nr:Transglutaminase-like superfamily [Acidimicrobiaceae bacterium]